MTTTNFEESKIQQFFRHSTIFLTGVTGVVGKILLEKLLRSSPDITKIHVLIRDKKGKHYEKRFEELLSTPLFEKLTREQPRFKDKINLMVGDCVLPDLGLNESDKRKLIEEVSCVFHCAATVRFDEKIRTATYINVRATRDALVMARQMKNLQAFVHVSTAYSNCVWMDIKEEFYEPRISGEKLLLLLDTLNDEMLDRITPAILGGWPNTYTFTKAVAEEVVRSSGKGLPVTMVRPSSVIATAKEPIPGWVDNIYGPTGIFLGSAMGVIHTLHCKEENLADMVPADFFVNCLIATAWDVGTKKVTEIEHPVYYDEPKHSVDDNGTKADEICVYNYVSSPQKPFNWREVMALVEFHLKQIPSPLQLWYYTLTLNSNYFMHMLFVVFFHRLPAYVMDFIAFCLGKERMMVKAYQKIEKFTNVLDYFMMREWHFENDNVQNLWKKLNHEDKKNFQFDMSAINWNSFFFTYARGGRVYLLKDPLETVPKGRARYLKLQIAHYVIVGLVLLGVVKLIRFIWKSVL